VYPGTDNSPGEDDGPDFGKDAVTNGVIGMVVRVDDELDGAVGTSSDLLEQESRSVDVREGVDGRHAVVTDHESGIRPAARRRMRILDSSPRIRPTSVIVNGASLTN
jgi:hypothetical protein